MRTNEYREHLQSLSLTQQEIQFIMELVNEFADFLDSNLIGQGATTKQCVEAFAKQLIVTGRNSLEVFGLLRDYAIWLADRPLYVTLVELVDCHNALDVLADEIETVHGQDVRNRIFSQPLPEVGAGEAERCAYSREVMGNMEALLSVTETRDAWFTVQHGIPAEVWQESDSVEREKFAQCGSIDAYLELKRNERASLLTRLRDEDQLWYTTAITDEVLEFVLGDPEMEAGRREGDKIYITKIPYNTARYLEEDDPKMKRYYACHCPMLREAILRDLPISPEVCNCSLGHASHYLAALGEEIKGEVLESVVKGDTRCRFVFYLPS